MLAGALLVLHEAGNFKRASAAMGLYFTMLAANVCWSLFFFGFRDPGIALGVLVALWLLIATMMLRFAVHSPRAALLQVPYLLWVTFAAYLNISVLALNPPP
jgi:tryptophan-rich sensory protein